MMQPFLADCYFQIAGDKRRICSAGMRLVLINQQLFYTERRERLPSYQDFTPLHSHMSAGARSAISSHVLQRAIDGGRLLAADMSHTSLFQAVRGRVDKKCVFRK